MPRQSYNSQAGFTLIEVIIAVSILALLSVVIAVSWRVAANAQSRVDAKVVRIRGVEAAADLLEKQVASVVPLRDPNVESARVVYFHGNGQSVRFVSRYSLGSKSLAGMVLVEYKIEREPEGDQLLIREREVRALSDLQGSGWPVAAAPGRAVPLSDAQLRYAFSYLVENLESRTKQAVGQWDGENGRLPLGISLLAENAVDKQQSSEWSFRIHTRDLARNAPGIGIFPNIW